MQRVVGVSAYMLDDEAEKLVAALRATKDDGLTALANEIQRARESTIYIATTEEGWETPRCKELCEKCDVEGCEEKRDPDDINDFCAKHADEWENSTGYFALGDPAQRSD